MRIIYLTSSSSKSGGARQALYTARALQDRGHDLLFFTPEESDLIPLDSTIRWRPLPADKNSWRGLIERELFASERPAIVHAHHNKAVKRLAWWGLTWHKRPVATAGHRGVIFRPHNPLPYWSPGIDRFTVNSRTCARIIRTMGVSARRIEVVYNGLPAGRLRPSRPAAEVRRALGLPEERREGGLVLGTVSGDAEYKGVQVLLPALAAGLPPGATAVLIGLGRDTWTARIRELGLEGRVHVVPYTENVADYLQILDLFILPSLQESMPNTLIEAVGLGLPVIASRVGATPELVQGNGLLYAPGDAAALGRAIAQACSDPERLEQWAAASRTLAGEFAMEHKVRRLETIYADMLKSRGLSPD